MGAEEILERSQFEQLIQGLMDDQFGYCNDFLPPSVVEGLRANMANLCSTGSLVAAGIGNKVRLQNNPSIRNDKMHWIDDNSSNVFEDIYLKKVWRFIQYLNTTCYTSIKSFESHYSNYEIGSFYKRHLDQFKNEKGRKYSIVLYLNQDWKEEDRGYLTLYPALGIKRDILPIEGRIVFFQSESMEHEVTPSFTRDRKSIAGWMKVL